MTKCPQCGEAPTYQTPDGTWWDSQAHFWRDDDSEDSPPKLDSEDD